MKFVKYAAIGLGGLILVVGAVLAYVAATFDPNQYKPQIIQAVKERTQRTLRLEGDIQLSFWPSIGAKVGKASLSERAAEREFAAIEQARVSLKLLPLFSGQAVVDAVEVKGLRAQVVKAKDGRTNVDDLAGASEGKPAPQAPAAGPPFRVDIDHVTIEDAEVRYTDQAAGAQYALSKLNLKTGRIAPGVPTSVSLSARVQSDQPAVALQTTLKTRLALDPERQSYALQDLSLEAKGAAAGLKDLALKATGNVRAALKTQQVDLSDLALSIRASDPGWPAKSLAAELKGRASVDGAKEQAQAELAGKLDESSIKARLGVNGFAKPAVRFDVDVDRLDVDRYASRQATGTPAPGGPSKPAPEKPFDLSALRGLRGAGTVKIGALKAANVKASDVRLEVKANGGRVDVDPLSANFYQGKLASAITVNAAPATPTFAVRHSLNGISIGPLLKDFADNDLLEGRGNVTVDVTTQGNTVSALKKALNGKAAVKLADGAVKGIDIAGSLRDAKARLGALRGEQTQQADKSRRTDFSELTATFNIRDGLARNNDLSLKSPLLRVGGEGEINLGLDTINYLVKASVVGTSQGQGGRELEELRGVTVPVRVTGALTAPSYRLDFGSMVTEKAKQELKSRLQERLLGGSGAKDEGAKEGAKSGSSTRDILRGLIGR